MSKAKARFVMPAFEPHSPDDVFAHPELLEFRGLPGLPVGTTGSGGKQTYCHTCPYRPSCPGGDNAICCASDSREV